MFMIIKEQTVIHIFIIKTFNSNAKIINIEYFYDCIISYIYFRKNGIFLLFCIISFFQKTLNISTILYNILFFRKH